MRLWIRPDRQEAFAGLDFEAFLGLGRHTVRTGPDGARRTAWFERDGRRYFLKVHSGIGWREIAKCWLQGKPAVVDALTETRALERLAELGIPAPRLVAYGEHGWNPARRRSFVLTEALSDTEDLAEFLAQAPRLSFVERSALTRALGDLTGRLHAARIAHRDLYLTHFRLRRAPQGAFELFLIDLHRARLARPAAGRWIGKELAALRFSTLGLALTRADLARFRRAYRTHVPEPHDRTRVRSFLGRIETRARWVRERVRRRDSAR